MSEPEVSSKKLSILKKWWFWCIAAIILAAVFFIPYIRVSAICAPCPEGRTDCPPCPTYNQSLVGYLIDKF